MSHILAFLFGVLVWPLLGSVVAVVSWWWVRRGVR